MGTKQLQSWNTFRDIMTSQQSSLVQLIVDPGSSGILQQLILCKHPNNKVEARKREKQQLQQPYCKKTNCYFTANLDESAAAKCSTRVWSQVASRSCCFPRLLNGDSPEKPVNFCLQNYLNKLFIFYCMK